MVAFDGTVLLSVGICGRQGWVKQRLSELEEEDQKIRTVMTAYTLMVTHKQLEVRVGKLEEDLQRTHIHVQTVEAGLKTEEARRVIVFWHSEPFFRVVLCSATSDASLISILKVCACSSLSLLTLPNSLPSSLFPLLLVRLTIFPV